MSYRNYEMWKHKPLQTVPYLSVIIPVFNEAERVLPTIGAIASHVSDVGFPWELIIADDGSTDGTPDLVSSLGLSNLRLLRAPQNAGKGNAVQRGMLAARGQYLLFTDADNSTPIEEISNLLRKVTDEGFAVAVGSRAIAGAAEAEKAFTRQLLSHGLRWLVRHTLRIDVRDTQCGFKLYAREAGRILHSQQSIMGFSFDLEVLFLAKKYGYQVAEVPVSWIDAPGSKVNARKEVQRFLRDLLKIRINDCKGKYEPAI